MKISLLFFFLFLFGPFSFCQNISEEDTLIKYSYFLQGYTDSTASISQGTGFFINNNGENLLITARHLLTGCRFNGSKNLNLPDEMMVYLTENDSLPFDFFSLDVRTIKDTAQCLQYYVSPDIISYPIHDTTGKEIYSIDRFLPSYLPRQAGKIVTFGYPSFNNIDSGRYFVKPARKLVIANYELHETFTYRNPEGSYVVDTINYTIKPEDLLVTDKLRGYSGSPVFMMDNDNQKWVFLGVIIAVDDKNNLLTIVKPQTIFEKIGYRDSFSPIASSLPTQ